MAVVKISELTNVETIEETDLIPIVNENETKNITVKQIIERCLENVSTLKTKIVTSVDEVTEENIIYFVPNEAEGKNIYDEYLFVNGRAELVGSKPIDLSSYPTTETVETMIESAIGTALEGSY